MRIVFYFALSTIILIIMTQVAESVINKPGKPVASNITKPKPQTNVSKPIRTLPNISNTKPSTPEAVQTMVPAPIITATPVPEIEDNNSPITAENEEFEEIAIGSDDEEAEEDETESSKEESVPVNKTKTKTKTRSKTNAIERLLNNSTVKTLIKGSTVAGGGLIGTVFTILIMFRLIKSI